MNMQSNAPNGVASSMNGASMPTMPTKTPVSLLQELCAKRGITPKYDLIQVEGAVHQPTFLYKATVGEFMATGQGQSKKKAKHAVAKAVLDLVLGNQAAPPGAPMAPVQADSLGQLVSPYDDGIAGNPVGQLQELCMAYRLPPPVYEPVSEQGLPHERTFTIACRIGTALSETGVGKSKKIAKRQASNLLLTKLRELPPPPAAESADPAAAGGETMDQTAQRLAEHFSALRLSQIPSLTASDSVQVGQFHRGLKAATGDALTQLRDPKSSPGSWNCLQFLQDLAKEQNFQLTWIDVEEKSFDGRCQCLVQLSTLPVAVCYGVGEDADKARSDAAHNALQYLKIMIK
ncbi:RISC-loading complex subunit tarbp2-like isoform X1 [Amphibalanus amphitrite]|uniref:RISC-loading complex subunit tarbp2-like isoform X1 n=1 Tax=Amphibalanus amphitrite TaxID=1232801 RepID=UPI001C90C6E0|nr:RISC-loading complex subunit tarbp2-like isoform X1 [Amphibalanus amphitrite]XP_043210479.1 RISC-loading complex subunit tarbp2-like isoform X1 [Amphibalanus amphitrite]XP_043210487.1 RISC-loading complex subunit tarbp2-like isoform X1 [Amphibalanus amphitrite]XP_043210496.1 RISC-loading complex subunit tarbp2-like isoform X1 [Amphibalanus amphitrite]